MSARMEEVIAFSSGEHQLTGILNPGDGSGGKNPRVGIVFANAGARGRLGSTFQYPYYARELAKAGYPSLRFDPHGIGDSEGLIEAREMQGFYGMLQSGLFVDDLLVAIEAFRRRVKPRRIVLWGVCGGAITSLIAAAKTNLVDGVVLLSVPVLLDSAEEEGEVIPAGYAREYLIAAYGKKLFSLEAWMRLFRGQSELDTIWSYSVAIAKGSIDRVRSGLDPRALVEQLKRRLRRMRAGRRRKVTHDADRHPMFNERFLTSLDRMIACHHPALFVFGEGDAIRWHFEEHFQQPFWQDDPAYAELCDVHYLAGCNHLFTLREWQDQALDIARPWLEKLS
ncbi:MAG: hypothetical protein CSB49_02790 [Proteobacteria bacterium]|nr:MAG: hypothetical protein CSB49_02790 [Pseudomonadota bacterium]